MDRTKLHPLTDIPVLTVICGADSFVAVALFGQLHEAWLRTLLELPHGIPSHDTLGRVFERTAGQVVPADGQSVRGSHDRGRGHGSAVMGILRRAALNMVRTL